MFGFDKQFAMFDVTPVENQYILELLPAAKGDYVKVYLYGLMYCYHPEESLSVDQIAHDLNMTAEDVLAAFRYWERKHAVRRVSDRPPQWEYVNIKQLSLAGKDTPDPEYESFSESVYAAFDNVRRLHGSELNTCFEWKEDLKLPTEVIIMLLKHMISVKGKNFKIHDAEKVALKMVDEKITTIEAAEAYFSRDEKTYAEVRAVLKMLGKNYLPSEAQVSLYRKWTDEWHFTPEAIREAVSLTAKGDPSMGYLDGILTSLRTEAGKPQTELKPEQVRRSSQKAQEFRAVLKELGSGEVNARNLELYRQMTEMYSLGVILAAARECGHSGKGPEDVLKLLQSWKKKGLESEDQVNEYIQQFHEQTALIREIRKVWGADERRISTTDRSLVSKWQNELGFSPEMILQTAQFASEAKMPMAYLDSILTGYQQKGIFTPEAALAEHRTQKKTGGKENNGSGTRQVSAQQYEQRDYRGVMEEMMEEQNREMEEYLRRNGGQSNA